MENICSLFCSERRFLTLITSWLDFMLISCFIAQLDVGLMKNNQVVCFWQNINVLLSKHGLD